MKSDFLLISKIINGVEITSNFKEIPNYFNEGREQLSLKINEELVQFLKLELPEQPGMQ
jgi:hypothetical protein